MVDSMATRSPRPTTRARATDSERGQGARPRGLRYGDARQVLVEAVGREVSQKGPNAVVLGEVCRSIGLSPSLVNYHFGSREQLLAEAVVHELAEFVAELNRVTYAVTESPQRQLAERIWYRLRWCAANPGVDSMVNYANILDPAGEILMGELGQRIGEIVASDMLGLHAALFGIYAQTVYDAPVPMADAAAVPELLDLTGYVALAALGASTWATGQSPSTLVLEVEFPKVVRSLLEGYVAQLIRHVEADIAEIRRRRTP